MDAWLCIWWLWWLLFMGYCTVLCIAPKGLGSSAEIASAISARTLGGAAAATAAAIGARVAASWAMRSREAGDKPAHFNSAGPSAARSSSKGMPVSQFTQLRTLPAPLLGGDGSKVEGRSDEELLDEDGQESEFDEWDSDDEWEGEEEEEEEEECVPCDVGSSAAPPSSSAKLWTKKQFPAGVESSNNWRMENLRAAQEWSCPCLDRTNCIGADRICVLRLYDHRQRFREHAGAGGLRDKTREELEGHYDETHGKFSRSFVVGPLGDCCAESAALAKGISFQTFASARADVRRKRPRRAARQEGRHRKESTQRAHIRAWIRSQVQGRSEGPKGGADPLDKWRTGYLPRNKRYEVYKEAQRRAGQPILCSSALLYQRRCPLLALVRLSACGVVHIACSAPSHPLRTPLPRSNKVWAAELKAGTIKEEKACGHGKCTRCSEIQTDKDRYRGRMDAEGKRLYAQALAEEATHAEEHGGERDYAEDWWDAAQRNPEAVTAFSMDAPTERQFDIPVQPRKARDTVKALENAKRWSSKITGLMISGIGILAYVTRDGLGSGGDLSCTVLYLAMCAMIAGGRKLGQRFNVLLDNTTGDNKNNEVIAFLAWLVAKDIVTEASTFFMMVDHTYCRIDQSFRALIGHLLSAAVYTPRRLVQSIFTYLQAYNCLGVSELHCIWDWKAFLEPHLHAQFKGFCTGQFGSGMHEFVLRKDRHGEVRLWLRKSSQASSWLPDGHGYPVFKSIPDGPPSFRAAKTDRQWKRAEVQSNVRSWFRFIPLEQAELTQVQAEWEQRFESLPCDGDISTLPASLHLPWVELPKVAPNRAVPQVTMPCSIDIVCMYNQCVCVCVCMCAAWRAEPAFYCARESGSQSCRRPRAHCSRRDSRAARTSSQGARAGQQGHLSS